MLKEFKNFILRGNVLDLAVGVIIGAAFTALVKSLVDNLINPLIGMFVQSTALAHLSVTVGKTKFTYGAFLNDALISSLQPLLFHSYQIHNISLKEETVEEQKNEELETLQEIRDLLKKQ
ncbi:large conductance mechanosensitive channel protein MscL [Lactococcus lactis]